MHCGIKNYILTGDVHEFSVETDVAPPSDNQTEEVPKTDPDPTAPPATEQPQPQELPPPSPVKRTKSKLSKEKKLVVGISRKINSLVKN